MSAAPSTRAPVRLLIVDDSRFVRTALRAIVAGCAEIEVIGEARDGAAAVELARTLRPDVITMDIEMPGMDGLEATRRIMAENPTPIIVLSHHSHPMAAATVRALGYGAVDILEKPEALVEMDTSGIERQLREKLLLWGRQPVNLATPRPAPTRPTAADPPRTAAPAAPRPAPVAGEEAMDVDLVVVGVSTGGPTTLPALLAAMGPLRCPVVVAQHMPEQFTGDFARHLREASRLDVVEGTDGLELLPGRVVILPGGADGEVRRRALGGLAVRLLGASASPIHPSANVLFASAAKAARAPVAVILTGMGDDGTAGAALFRERGRPVLAQTPATAVVWGMPNAAITAGVVSESLPVEEIGRRLARWAGAGPASSSSSEGN